MCRGAGETLHVAPLRAALPGCGWACLLAIENARSDRLPNRTIRGVFDLVSLTITFSPSTSPTSRASNCDARRAVASGGRRSPRSASQPSSPAMGEAAVCGGGGNLDGHLHHRHHSLGDPPHPLSENRYDHAALLSSRLRPPRSLSFSDFGSWQPPTVSSVLQ